MNNTNTPLAPTEPIPDLNNKQTEAVSLAPNSNALILAGAGSGKTRVLTYRIAQLIKNNGIRLDAVLAVTFTNKAANEMKQRLEVLLHQSLRQMWLGTFHGLAHRLLRMHSNEAGLKTDFQIIDGQDQFRLIRKIMKTLSIDEAKFPVKKIQTFINQQKDEGIRSEGIDSEYNYFIKKAAQVYQQYEQQCQALNIVDFAELLLRAHELLRDNSTLLSHYQRQFSHLLVDEFQDTNRIQYAFIKLLHNDNNYLFCVGDDDQSIYGWRGADIANMQNIERDFAPLITIRLEQNYRSTGNILKASNHLISCNSNRLGKSLWTDAGDGEPIKLYGARSDMDEAQHVAERLNHYFDQGVNASQCAILYRSNAQSRVLEEVFIKTRIPYIIYGGLRFFERAEIKNALAYLRLCLNVNDDGAFDRIVNLPPRGIGSTTVNKIHQYAQQNNTSLWQAATDMVTTLPARSANALSSFTQLITNAVSTFDGKTIAEKIATILEHSTLIDYYQKDEQDKTNSKVDNLSELINAAKHYQYDETLGEDETSGFLAATALQSDNASTNNNDNVQLMTIHAAKGLEFNYVFMVGLEEDLFPSRQSKESPHLLAEERRLCYVGMTRAMQQLHLSYAEKRFMHGQTFFAYPSRFLSEIPSSYLNHLNKRYNSPLKQKRPLFNDEQPNTASADKHNDFAVGNLVKHQHFGMGKVTNLQGRDEAARIEVNFINHGKKWLVSRYAKLTRT